jgi:hypothetical protein
VALHDPAHTANTDLTIPPFLDRRGAPVTGDGALIPAQVLTLTRRIKALVEKGDRAAEKADQFYKSAGIHIKEIKQRQSEHWETIVREKCGLGRSRAYELMAIADGKTTLEKVRASSNERKKVHRAKPESVPERTQPVKKRADEERDRKTCVELNQKVLDAERERVQWLADHPAAEQRPTGSAEVSIEQHRERMGRLDAPAEETVDEVDRRVSCVANTIRGHVEGLTYSDGARFFAALRDRINDIERDAGVS